MGACGGGAFVDRWWVTGERDAGYTDRWGAYERIGVGRLVVAVAASAAICVSGTARAESPRATIEGQLDRDLREAATERTTGRLRERGDQLLSALCLQVKRFAQHRQRDGISRARLLRGRNTGGDVGDVHGLS